MNAAFLFGGNDMKKYEVIQSFIDAETRMPYNKGKLYATDNDARAMKLAAGGYIILPKAGTGAAAEATPETGTEKPDGETTLEAEPEADTEKPNNGEEAVKETNPKPKPPKKGKETDK